MFKLRGELLLMLYPRAELARDANTPLGTLQSGEFSIGHSVAYRVEVDAILYGYGVGGWWGLLLVPAAAAQVTSVEVALVTPLLPT